MSLPSRGAWIEIPSTVFKEIGVNVAPLAGSVDRNLQSAGCAHPPRYVAPLAGSVDRNLQALELPLPLPSRSPRGERG